MDCILTGYPLIYIDSWSAVSSVFMGRVYFFSVNRQIGKNIMWVMLLLKRLISLLNYDSRVKS